MNIHAHIDRRLFLAGTAMAIAGASATRTARAQSGIAAFASVKQIDAGDLSIGYADVGSAAGKPVLLFHGWPYDIHTYVDVAPMLAAAGYRVIVPYLRGY